MSGTAQVVLCPRPPTTPKIEESLETQIWRKTRKQLHVFPLVVMLMILIRCDNLIWVYNLTSTVHIWAQDAGNCGLAAALTSLWLLLPSVSTFVSFVLPGHLNCLHHHQNQQSHCSLERSWGVRDRGCDAALYTCVILRNPSTIQQDSVQIAMPL